MPAMGIEACEDDTRLHFDVESDLPRFLVEQHIVVVDQTVRLLRIPQDSSSNINAYDKETLDNLSSAFSDVDQPCSNV